MKLKEVDEPFKGVWDVENYIITLKQNEGCV